jgi:hypothetical protein
MIDIEEKVPGLTGKIKKAEGLPIQISQRLWDDLVRYFRDGPSLSEDHEEEDSDDHRYENLKFNEGIENLFNDVVDGTPVWLSVDSEPMRICAEKKGKVWTVN